MSNPARVLARSPLPGAERQLAATNSPATSRTPVRRGHGLSARGSDHLACLETSSHVKCETDSASSQFNSETLSRLTECVQSRNPLCCRRAPDQLRQHALLARALTREGRRLVDATHPARHLSRL